MLLLARRNWLGAGLLAVGGVVLLVPPSQAVTFSEATESAGITHNALPPNQPTAPTFAQVQSGGAAAGDFDGDGWVDLFVTRYFDSDLLYRNNGDGTFSDVTHSAFPEGIGNLSTNGAAWGDVDNDGHLDLYVAGLDETRHFLYRNTGDGTFVEEAVLLGAAVGDGSRSITGTSPAFGDFDNDGYLDLYVTEWHGFGENAVPSHARLLRNLGAANPGHFADVTEQAGVSMDTVDGPFPGRALSFTPRFADLDRDGWQDLAIASDGRTTRLFWNNGDGTFTDGTPELPVLTSGTNDMGLTLGDVDGDGLADWFATSIYEPPHNQTGNHLYKNNGDRTFADITSAAGVRDGGFAWGTDMFDYDNDGDLDIVLTNGFTQSAYQQNQRVRLFENDGEGAFTERGLFVGMHDISQGRGLLTFDYDNDGFQDVFIVNNNGSPVLYRNNGGENGWLQIDLEGTISNRDGVGAVITVTPDLAEPGNAIVWEVDASSNYLAQSAMTAHFGLGADTASVDRVTIFWPVTGLTQVLTAVGSNQRLMIVEQMPADFNLDGVVDSGDLLDWQLAFGQDAGGDADRDGDSDGADFLTWQRQFGRGSPLVGANTVPEPSGVVLLAGLTAGFAGRPNRRRLVRRSSSYSLHSQAE